MYNLSKTQSPPTPQPWQTATEEHPIPSFPRDTAPFPTWSEAAKSPWDALHRASTVGKERQLSMMASGYPNGGPEEPQVVQRPTAAEGSNKDFRAPRVLESAARTAMRSRRAPSHGGHGYLPGAQQQQQREEEEVKACFEANTPPESDGNGDEDQGGISGRGAVSAAWLRQQAALQHQDGGFVRDLVALPRAQMDSSDRQAVMISAWEGAANGSEGKQQQQEHGGDAPLALEEPNARR